VNCQALETSLGANCGDRRRRNDGFIIIKIFQAVQVGNESESFITGMNFVNPVAMRFRYPQGIIGTVGNFPGETKAIPFIGRLTIAVPLFFAAGYKVSILKTWLLKVTVPWACRFGSLNE